MRHYGSTFLGHGRHTDVLNYFVGMTKDRKSECSYQMTMDGPTANMKFLQEFSAKLMNENYHSPVDSGTFSRHNVHGAFGTGAGKSG